MEAWLHALRAGKRRRGGVEAWMDAVKAKLLELHWVLGSGGAAVEAWMVTWMDAHLDERGVERRPELPLEAAQVVADLRPDLREAIGVDRRANPTRSTRCRAHYVCRPRRTLGRPLVSIASS